MNQFLSLSMAQRIGATTMLMLVLALAIAVPAATAQTFSVTPTSVTFKQVNVGTVGLAYTVTVKNTAKTGNVIINSYSITPSEFQFFYGWSPVTLTPGALINYSTRFAPDSATTFNGTFTINIQGANPVIVPLTGTGVATSASPSISVPSLTFATSPFAKYEPYMYVTQLSVEYPSRSP